MNDQILSNMYLLCEAVEISEVATQLGISHYDFLKRKHLLDHDYSRQIKYESNEPSSKRFKHRGEAYVDEEDDNKYLYENKENIFNESLDDFKSFSSDEIKYNQKFDCSSVKYISKFYDTKLTNNEIVNYSVKAVLKLFTIDELKLGIFQTKKSKKKKQYLDKKRRSELIRLIGDHFNLDTQLTELIWAANRSKILRELQSYY